MNSTSLNAAFGEPSNRPSHIFTKAFTTLNQFMCLNNEWFDNIFSVLRIDVFDVFFSLLNDTNDLIWIRTIFGVSQMNIFINCAFDVSSRIGELFFSFYLSHSLFLAFWTLFSSTMNRSIRHSTIGNRLLKNETSKNTNEQNETRNFTGTVPSNEMTSVVHWSNRVHKAFTRSFSNTFESKYSCFIVGLLHFVINNNH